MLRPPNRSSLVTATAQSLRSAIHEGTWQNGLLPSERVLVERLHVSRSTLRAALEVLTTEGLLTCTPGERRKINMEADSVNSVVRNRVVVLLPQPPSTLNTSLHYSLFELQDALRALDCSLDLLFHPKTLTRRPQTFLKTLTHDYPQAVWLLASATKEAQSWFAQSGLPSLIIGTCHDEIALPSLDVDLGAAVRHAVGLLLARGHKHIALVRTTVKAAGMDLSEHEFRTAMAQSSRAGVKAHVVSPEPNPEAICRALDRLLKKPDSPTAIVGCDSKSVLTIISYLHVLNYSLGKDISIIARDTDSSLFHFRPEISRYSFDRKNFVRRLIRLVGKLLQNEELPPRAHRVLPQFIEGVTVNPPLA